MIQNIQLKRFIAIVVMALPVAVAQAETISIETVPVENLDNADDIHGSGYGSVSYAYGIGTHEVTAGQYTAFLNAVAATDAYGLYNANMWSHDQGCKVQQSGSTGNYSYTVAADWASRPVNYVSWGDAARFTNWLHNGQPTGTLTGDPTQDAGLTEDGSYYINGVTSPMALMAISREDGWKWALPSEDEWYKAAYYDSNKSGGAGYYDYPTGTDDVPSNALNGGGNNATFNDSGYTIDSPYWRTEAGAHTHSASPYGTFDQGGNVWEWNEDVIYSSYRVMRGGSFGGSKTTLRASNNSPNDPTDEGSQIGFRVVSVPEPGSIALLVCGAVTSLIWWRRGT